MFIADAPKTTFRVGAVGYEELWVRGARGLIVDAAISSKPIPGKALEAFIKRGHEH
jgi:hypothetical protein